MKEKPSPGVVEEAWRLNAPKRLLASCGRCWGTWRTVKNGSRFQSRVLMVFASPSREIPQDNLNLRPKQRNLNGDHVPNDVVIDSEVVMDQPISHR